MYNYLTVTVTVFAHLKMLFTNDAFTNYIYHV